MPDWLLCDTKVYQDIQRYANIYIYIHIYIYAKYQAGAGPPRPWRLGAGPGVAAPPPPGILYTLVYFCISWRSLAIYLNIFGYMFDICSVGIFVDPNDHSCQTGCAGNR